MRNLLDLAPALFAIPSPASGWAFWTFKPEDFLKNPVYSRDYPPCKHC